jgi:hypothetical protein
MTTAKERKDRLRWHEPTREENLTAHLFDDKFPAWSVCHRIQRVRGFTEVSKRPATVCGTCLQQYGELLEWIAKNSRR